MEHLYLYAICIISLFVSTYGELCPTCLTGPADSFSNALKSPGEINDVSNAIASLAEGRGKKKKHKNTLLNMMIGGSLMVAVVMMIMFLNVITVTLGKAFLFTFIAKFLVSVNWKNSDSSAKKSHKSSHKDVTVLMA